MGSLLEKHVNVTQRGAQQHTMAGSGAEKEARVARQTGAQAAFSVVTFHIKQLGSALLSSTEAKNLVLMPQNREERRKGDWIGCLSRSCTSSRGSSLENKSTSSQCPLQEEAQVFSPILGLSRQAESSRLEVCHPRLALIPTGQFSVGQGPRGPAAHPWGLTGEKSFCT